MDRKILILTVILLIIISTNIFANILIIQLIADNSEMASHCERLKREHY